MQILAVQVPTPYIQGGLLTPTSKMGTPLKSGYFTDIGSSQLQIGTDMLLINHNKQWNDGWECPRKNTLLDLHQILLGSWFQSITIRGMDENL